MVSETHFLSFSKKTVKQFILPLEHIFLPILHPGQWKRVLCLLETILYYSEFLLLVETITETWGKSIFKDESYSCSSTPVFSIFSEISKFFKVEATFLYSGNAFSTNLSSGQWERIFCLVETVFFDQSYFSASGSHYWNQEGINFQKSLLLLVDY